MPSPTLALTVLTTLSPLAHALGRAIVTNQCDAPIYLWSVGSTISNATTLPKDSSYSETFHTDPVSGGVALKITAAENGLWTANASQTIFAYALDASQSTVWYDLSDLFGDGFAGRTLKVTPSDGACEAIVWGAGRMPAGEGGSQFAELEPVWE
ncbi:hypothetical protein ACEQ8H_006784 [Pleosporales sp. CAS-2024a]